MAIILEEIYEVALHRYNMKLVAGGRGLSEDNFSKQNNILAISFKGSAITNSKAIKFKIDNNLTKITIGVENDFILTGKADKDENTYTYYLFPYSSNNEIENIAITFKKI